MFISENDANRVLDKITQFSSQRDFLLSIISTLHTTEVCDLLINLIDKGMIITKTQVSGLTLLIEDERKKATGYHSVNQKPFFVISDAVLLCKTASESRLCEHYSNSRSFRYRYRFCC